MELKQNIEMLENEDINFYYKQLENLSNRTNIEIVFTGTLSNGKSTLINALIGRNLLPSKLGATTSLVTTIEKGYDKIVAILIDGKKIDYPLTKESIEDISSRNDIEHIEIFISDFKFEGIRFVDTPGIDDISKFREDKTINYVPLADVVVFVLDASKGMTADEKNFFEDKVIKTNKDKIFILLNKIDRENSINIDNLVPLDIQQEYKVYATSALKYLVGIINSDDEKRKESNLNEFINDLESYINSLDKKQTLNRRKLKSLNSIELLANLQIDTLINNLSKSKPEIERSLNELTEKLKDLENKKEQIEKEIDITILEVKQCGLNYINEFKADIQKVFNSHEQSKIELFNKEIPLICNKLKDNLKYCSSKGFKEITIEIEEIDNILLNIVANIDLYIDKITMLLNFISQLKGKEQAIALGLKKLVDMFGGTVVDNVVNNKLDILFNSVESSFSDLLNNYKIDLLNEYEHKELGKIRTEIVASKHILKKQEYEKNTLESKSEYFNKIKLNVDNKIEKIRFIIEGSLNE